MLFILLIVLGCLFPALYIGLLLLLLLNILALNFQCVVLSGLKSKKKQSFKWFS